ncbi:MAG: hypothetical protein AAFO15_02785, partial [Pseudomonadota bacterium]
MITTTIHEGMECKIKLDMTAVISNQCVSIPIEGVYIDACGNIKFRPDLNAKLYTYPLTSLGSKYTFYCNDNKKIITNFNNSNNMITITNDQDMITVTIEVAIINEAGNLEERLSNKSSKVVERVKIGNKMEVRVYDVAEEKLETIVEVGKESLVLNGNQKTFNEDDLKLLEEGDLTNVLSKISSLLNKNEKNVEVEEDKEYSKKDDEEEDEGEHETEENKEQSVSSSLDRMLQDSIQSISNPGLRTSG